MQGGLGDVDHGAAQVGGEAGLFVVAVHFVVLAAARRAQAAAFGAEVDVAGAVAFVPVGIALGVRHCRQFGFARHRAEVFFARGVDDAAVVLVVVVCFDHDVAVQGANQAGRVVFAVALVAVIPFAATYFHTERVLQGVEEAALALVVAVVGAVGFFCRAHGDVVPGFEQSACLVAWLHG